MLSIAARNVVRIDSTIASIDVPLIVGAGEERGEARGIPSFHSLGDPICRSPCPVAHHAAMFLTVCHVHGRPLRRHSAHIHRVGDLRPAHAAFDLRAIGRTTLAS